MLLFLFPPRAVLPTPVLSCGVRFTWELVLWELAVSGVWTVQRGSVSAGRIGRVLCSRLGVCAIGDLLQPAKCPRRAPVFSFLQVQCPTVVLFSAEQSGASSRPGSAGASLRAVTHPVFRTESCPTERPAAVLSCADASGVCLPDHSPRSSADHFPLLHCPESAAASPAATNCSPNSRSVLEASSSSCRLLHAAFRLVLACLLHRRLCHVLHCQWACLSLSQRGEAAQTELNCVLKTF